MASSGVASVLKRGPIRALLIRKLGSFDSGSTIFPLMFLTFNTFDEVIVLYKNGLDWIRARSAVCFMTVSLIRLKMVPSNELGVAITSKSTLSA